MSDSALNDTESIVKELADIKRALAQSTIVAFTDQTGKITYVNDKFCEISKYSRKELLGQDHRIINSGYHEKEFFCDLWKTIASGEIWRGEICNRAKDGSIYWVATTIIPFLNEENKPYQYVAVRHDITKQKQSNERIRQQASLLDKTRDAILVCDLNHKIIYWNKGAEKIYGWKTEEVLGKEICDVVCKGDQTVIEQALAVLEKADEWQEEAPNFTRDGREITVISRWTLVRKDDGKPDYFLVVNTDISDLKRAEHQLLRAQRLESIGTLAGGIAHDLNNVLSPILMAVDMLEAEFEMPESSLPWLSIIRENTERGADLIKQVLTFARGTSTGGGEQVQVSYLIKELIAIWKKTLPQNIRIEYDIKPQLPLVSVESTQLHQVLMNLAVNAKDAMKDAGGTLRVSAEQVEIDEHYAQMNPSAKPGQYVLITVEDTGSGMTPETLERIWDPFFTTKEVGEGTGLGLSTTLSIVKSNGGFINAYSEPGRGTQIAVYFPAVEIPHEETTEDVLSAFPEGQGELILIVDDEENIRRVTSATLERYGYRTVTAADGTEAIAVYSQQEKVALVITDMAMPYMDGAATIRALRKIDPGQKIIAASGLTTAQQNRTSELKVNAFLAKPFTSGKLLNTVAEVLAESTDR